jgi:oxaloacetate decarboxylase gamma subunit
MENLNQLFFDAGTLMVVGMVFVFSFLGLLVLIINKLLTPLAKAYPDPVIQPKRKTSTVQSPQPSSGISPAIVAAISAAVSTYRQQNKKP